MRLFLPLDGKSPSFQILTNLFLGSILIGTSVITGRLNKVEFDAINLANSFLATYGQAIVIGLSTACDTLFSQTMGSRDKKRTGIWLQKSLLIINAITIVICGVHMNLEPIYLLIGQFPEVAKLASEASLSMAPSLIFFANLIIFVRYLQNQDIIYVPVMISLIASIFNVITQYMLIIEMGYGFIAAAYVQSASYAMMLILIVAYILIGKKYRDTWDGLKREALTCWGEFAHLAFCGVGHYTFESVCLNIGIIFAGTLSEDLLATQSIIYQIDNIFYTISYSLSISLNIRIGQLLGQMNPTGAKTVLKCGFILAGILSAVSAVIINTCRYSIAAIFTNHQDIVYLVAFNLPIISLVFTADCFRGCVDGTLRGVGRQSIGAIINILSFCVVGLPTAILLLLLTNFKLIGYWFGIVLGNGVILVCAITFIAFLDWQKEAVRTQERVLKAYKSQSAPDEKTALLPQRNLPRKHPRQPTSCSTNFEEMTYHADVTDSDFRRLCLLRGFTIVGCLLLLVAAIVVHTAIPRDVYATLGRNVTSA